MLQLTIHSRYTICLIKQPTEAALLSYSSPDSAEQYASKLRRTRDLDYIHDVVRSSLFQAANNADQYVGRYAERGISAFFTLLGKTLIALIII